MGHFLLVNLLTEKIKVNAPSRIINVSSCANSQLLPREGIDFDNLNGEKGGYSAMGVYAQAKLANIYHVKELQRRFDAEGVDLTVVSIYPGNSMLVSSLLRTFSVAAAFWDACWNMRNCRLLLREAVALKNLETSASTGILCSISDDIVKGKFYSDNTINTDLVHEEADNKKLAKKLWVVSERLLADKM